MPDHRNIDRGQSPPLNIRLLNCHTPPLKPERIPTATINQGLVGMEKVYVPLDSQRDKPCPPSPLVQFPCSRWKSTVIPILDGCLEIMECVEKCEVSFELGRRDQLRRTLGLVSKLRTRSEAEWFRWRRRWRWLSKGGLVWDGI